MAEQGDPQEQVPHGRTPGACQPAAGEKDPGTAGVPAASGDPAALVLAMAAYDAGDPRRIHHFLKVHELARTIGLAEGLDARTLHVLEAAAIVHDAGIHESERVYGNASGAHQEELGPAVARPLLERAGYDAASVERACWLVAHHHTYIDIDDVDHRVLVEADFLVNAYEDAPEDPAARSRVASQVAERVFRTRTGLALLRSMYLSDAYAPLP